MAGVVSVVVVAVVVATVVVAVVVAAAVAAVVVAYRMSQQCLYCAGATILAAIAARVLGRPRGRQS